MRKTKYFLLQIYIILLIFFLSPLIGYPQDLYLGNRVIRIEDSTAKGTVYLIPKVNNIPHFVLQGLASQTGDLLNCKDSAGNTLSFIDSSGKLTLSNSGLHLLDSDATHDLIISPGSNLTADKTLTFTTGDSDRTLTLSGSPTLNDWFDQSVKTTASPSFVTLTTTAGYIDFTDANVAHGLTSILPTNTYSRLTSLSSTAGGLNITAISDTDAQSLQISGIIGSTNPTDTIPAVKIIGAKSNGTTGQADLGDAETVFQVQNNDNTPVMTVLGNGNVGIGTTRPSVLLHINSAGSTDQLIVQRAGVNRFIIHGDGTYTIVSGSSIYRSDFNRHEFRLDHSKTFHIGFTSGQGTLFANYSQNDVQLDRMLNGGGSYSEEGSLLRLYRDVDNVTSESGYFLSWEDADTGVLGVINSSGNVGIGTTLPSSLLDLQKVGTAKAITDMLEITNSGNAADMDGTGTGILFNFFYNDAIPAVANAARIAPIAETDWTSTASTRDSALVFQTALDGTVAEKMRIDSAGNVGIGTTAPATKLDVAGNMQISSSTANSGGGYKKTYSEATATLSGVNTTIQIDVPAGARLLGTQLRVDTLIESTDGGTSWAATYSGGAAQAIGAAGQAFTKNTKVNAMFNDTTETDIPASEVDILIDCDGAYTFSAGVVHAITYYETFTNMSDKP